MSPTRQFWRTSALVLFLACFAAVIASPALLLASASIAALLGVRQLSFYIHCDNVDSSVSIDIAHPQTYVQQHKSTTVTLTVTLSTPAPVDTRVSVPTPLLADGSSSELAVTVPAGEQRATATVQLTWPTAGTATFDRPTVTVRSRDGLFSQSFHRGPAPSVVVEPGIPRNVHVGEGGSRVNASFGAHQVGHTGQGTDPAELREYVAGDDFGDIDWKTTARQGEPYVLEYEVETDRRVVLLFDHSESTAVGQPGEQAVAYLREVALAIALSAAESGDPLALYTVDDDGLTNQFEPETGATHYRSIRMTLHDIETAPPTEGPSSKAQFESPTHGGLPYWGNVDSERAHRKVTALAGEESPFATQLTPYLRRRRQYVRRIEGDPLFDVARTYVGKLQGGTQTLIFTDDSDPAAVHETVKVARSRSEQVTVFLTPQSLFEDGGLTDLEAVYNRYAEFESFRQQLASLTHVSAYEVTPADRTQAVLAAGRSYP